jgi:hypothetical protein
MSQATIRNASWILVDRQVDGQQIVYGVGLRVYVYTLAVRALSAARRVLVGLLLWVFRNGGLASAGSPRAKAGR